jgi:hypothetical protein
MRDTFATIDCSDTSTPEQTMPKTHTIAVYTDGTAEWTRAPALDKFFEGAGRMSRITDIRKHDESPLYCIFWMRGPYACNWFCRRHLMDIYGCCEEEATMLSIEKGALSMNAGLFAPLYVRSYQEAVDWEIEMLNYMRKDGVRFGNLT